MKVLLVGPVTESGGYSRFVRDMLATRYPVSVALHNIARPPKKNMRRYRIATYGSLLNAGFARLLQSVFITVRKYLAFPGQYRRTQPDLVYLVIGNFDNYWEMVPYIWLSRLARRPYILHFLGPTYVYYDKCTRFARWTPHYHMAHSARTFVLTRRDLALFRSCCPEKVRYVPSSVDVRRISRIAAGPHKGNGDGPISVLFLGGVDPYRKGLDMVVKAIPAVVRQVQGKVRFVLCGNSAVETEMRALAPECASHVKFLGLPSEEEVVEQMAKCDILMLPSYDEGLPYAVVEAMAFGMAVVATRVGGIPDAISDGQNGVLVDPGQAEQLAAALARLIDDPTSIRIMGRRVSERASEEYCLEKMHAAIFKECAGAMRQRSGDEGGAA